MKFIAHRGYSAKWPENTIKAFKAVFEHNSFSEKEIIGIELDIQLTSDEKIIVFHDTSVETGNGKIPVAHLDYETLRVKYGKRPEPLEIPLFGEVLDFISHRTALYVEIKESCYNMDILISYLKELLKKYSPANDIIIHSFSVEAMKKAMKEFTFPGIEFGFLCSSLESVTAAGADFMSRMNYLHPKAAFLLENEDFFLKHGKVLNNVWTVNDIAVLKKLENAQCASLIKAVTTDDLELIEKWKSHES